MRPVERGAWPLDPITNQPKQFSTYSASRKDLINRMGQYCSYCESRLNASLAVEHVQPKSVVPGLELDWENFLLACTNCNSTKGATPIDLLDYFWPDLHNTFIPFQYHSDGRVELNQALSSTEKRKAQGTLKLVGLQKYPDTDSASDRRWINRTEAFQKALRAKQQLADATALDARIPTMTLLIDLATATGFFSVWFSVFSDQLDVLGKLLAAFPGTDHASFDSRQNFRAIRRNSEM